MKKLIDKKVLDLYYKYDRDLSLLDEPWAKQEDKKLVSFEQSVILGKYVDNLHFLKLNNLSDELRKKTEQEITELEQHMEQDVIDALRNEINRV